MADIWNPYGRFGRYSADLCLFLLVAENGQFSRAAEEAGISQPRISQRMRFLEESLGCQLFVRERRGVSLTGAGQELRAVLSEPMNAAIKGFDRFCDKPRPGEVVILSDIAFANFLLLPEFASLSTAFDGLSISLMNVQMPQVESASGVDLMIRMEDIHEVAQHEVCLFKERVATVCSAAYRDAHPGMTQPEDLLDKTLIDLAAVGPTPWYTWFSWLREQGCERSASQDHIAFNSYDHVIRAAQAGLGIALGWEGLVDVHSPTSTLVRAIPARLESDRGYYLKILPGHANADTIKVFEWLAERFARGDG